jgi:hypothetical protein
MPALPEVGSIFEWSPESEWKPTYPEEAIGIVRCEKSSLKLLELKVVESRPVGEKF